MKKKEKRNTARVPSTRPEISANMSISNEAILMIAVIYFTEKVSKIDVTDRSVIKNTAI